MASQTLTGLQTSFSRRFLKRMAAHAPKTPRTTELSATPQDTVELSGDQLHGAVASAVLSASQVSGVAVGAALALSIASQLGRELVSPEVREEIREEASKSWNRVEPSPELDETWQKIMSQSELPDPQLVCIEKGDNSPMALMGDVYMSKDARRQFSDPAERAFALGHELAHLETRDSEAQLGVKFLLESLEESSPLKPEEMAELKTEITAQIRQEDHRQEYQADQRGLEIAISLGHDPASAIGFLCGYPENDGHPAGDDRVRALVKQVKASRTSSRPKL